MSLRRQRSVFHASAIALAIALCGQVNAQEAGEVQLDDSTIIYEAAFFNQYSPVNVNDMIDRIPGISLALGGGGGGGGNNNRRGLGSGENEVLINGQRQTGKSNEGRSQLSRISADQVDYIEIIRGTSEEMDVRGGGQVVNIVLLDVQSRSSYTAEVNGDYKQDDTFQPGANFSVTGQRGAFNYLLAVQSEPRYNNTTANEVSRDADGNLLETRFEESTRDQSDYQTSFNLGYQFDNSQFQLNGLYGENSPPEDKFRTINDFSDGSIVSRYQREFTDRNQSNWEIGGDYEYGFHNGGKYRLLFIVNDRDSQSTRERFNVSSTSEQKDLFLFNAGRDQERIARTSYTWNVASSQGLEMGVERAQTIRTDNLKLGIAGDELNTSTEYGGLVPVNVNNANSAVQEIRYENFAIHNWQLNDKMSLESTLIYELSTISQAGDINKERDFSFVRPKIDYRYNITREFQLRATIEKQVSQLSFRDFSTSSDNDDEDANVQAGNPDIVQEQSWNYALNLEYRLPNNIGVLASEIFYRDISDVIDRVDVSTGPDNLLSARGNIGDGERLGVRLDASTRLGYIGLPSALLTTSFTVQDSTVTDPFLGIDRRMRYNSRWFGRANYRHDITAWQMSYGVSYFASDNQSDARTQIDIIDIEREIRDYGLSLFVEKRAFGGVTFRFDVRDANNPERCRDRIRFDGATAGGVVEEVENYCSQQGPNYSLKIRHTF